MHAPKTCIQKYQGLLRKKKRLEQTIKNCNLIARILQNQYLALKSSVFKKTCKIANK